MGVASDRQAKLAFIKYVNETRKKIDNEMSVTLGGLRTSLPRKSSYGYGDLKDLVEEAEKLAKSVSDRSLLAISKQGVKLFGSGGAPIEITQDTSAQVERLQEEMESLKAKLEAAQSSTQQSVDLERVLEEKDSEIIQLQGQIEQSQKEKSAEIAQLQDLVKRSKIRVNEYLEEINTKQANIDDLNRTIATNQDDRAKLEGEIMKIGNTMMDYTTQVERLQAVLSSRDTEIENQADLLKQREDKSKRVAELEEAIVKAAERISGLKSELKAAQEQSTAQMEEDVQTLTSDLGDLKDENESLQAENETLLAEVERTSRHAEEVAKESEELRKNLRELEENSKVSEADLRVQENRLGEIEAERDQAREELLNLRGGELRELKNSLSSLETKFREKNLELEEGKDEIARFQSQLSSNDERIQDLRQRIKDSETERDELESLIPDQKGLQNELNRVVKSLSEARAKIDEFEGVLSERSNQISSLKAELEESSGREEQLEDVLEDMKRYLSENPKYQILFILSDLKTTGVVELSKAIGRPVAVARQLIKSLDSEGWVSVDGEKVILEKSFLDL